MGARVPIRPPDAILAEHPHGKQIAAEEDHDLRCILEATRYLSDGAVKGDARKIKAAKHLEKCTWKRQAHPNDGDEEAVVRARYSRAREFISSAKTSRKDAVETLNQELI